MKTCVKCHIEESVGGKNPWCRECSRAYHREYDRKRTSTDSGVQKQRLRAQVYRKKNRDTIREKQRSGLDGVHALKDNPCVDCNKRFPYWCMDFDHVRGVKSNGVGRLVGACQERIQEEVGKCDLVCSCCHRVRTTSRVRLTPTSERRHQFLERLSTLKSFPCVDCGLTYAPECMDFDHVRGEKVIRVSLMTTWVWEKVLLEVSKCDLVCSNCHRTRTMTRKGFTVPTSM